MLNFMGNDLFRPLLAIDDGFRFKSETLLIKMGGEYFTAFAWRYKEEENGKDLIWTLVGRDSYIITNKSFTWSYIQ